MKNLKLQELLIRYVAMVIAAKKVKNKTSHVLRPSHSICSMSGERAVSQVEDYYKANFQIAVNLKMAAMFPPLNALRQSSTGPSAPNVTCLSLSISRGRSPVQDGFSAAVQVVELLLGHRVVYVHGGHAQFPGFGQLIQPGGKKREVEAPTLCECMLFWGRNSPVNASDALLYDTPDLLEHIWVFLVHPVCQVPSVIKDLTGKKQTVEKRYKLLFYKTET